MKNLFPAIMLAVLATLVPGLAHAGGAHGHDHGEHDVKPKHGGVVLEVGEHVAHLEVIYDEKHGVVKVWLSTHEGDKPIEGATIGLNVRFKKGHQAFELTPVKGHPGGHMTESPKLKGHFVKARFKVTLGDKTYLVDFEHDHAHDHDDHGHDHEGHDHEGHDHD